MTLRATAGSAGASGPPYRPFAALQASRCRRPVATRSGQALGATSAPLRWLNFWLITLLWQGVVPLKYDLELKMKDTNILLRGSEWRRWDPHIHAPGTVLNDQYPSFEGEPTEEAWDLYLNALEASNPIIEAIGITDYYSTDCYQKVREFHQRGRLGGVGLIFPNVELRYGVGTAKGTPVNFHLMVSPEDSEHLEKLARFLAKLTFKSGDDTYRCTPEDIRRLGRDFTGRSLSDRTAFSEGANQFKVEVDSFIEAWHDTKWIRDNALIAVPGSNQDGSAGLQKDASLAALRQKIERISHIIFASQPSQRDFWAGLSGKLLESEFIKSYGCYKPCLHGSDAHELARVGTPDLQRYTWLKGDLSFESLRQACIEPVHRAIVATDPPIGALPSQVISCVGVKNADWFGSQPIPLNAGLIGIIGARGSGKTALADMIAGGAYALSEHVNEKSFVRRARKLLGDAAPYLHWQDGSETYNPLSSIDHEEIWDTPKVQYLSQQFVEQLCSADGATEALLKEIQRVIFLSHPHETRADAVDFDQLLDLRAARGREARQRYETAIAYIGDQIGKLRDQHNALGGLVKQRDALARQREKDNDQRAKLVPKSAEKHAEDFEKVTLAAEKVRQAIEGEDRRLAQLDLLEDYVNDFQSRQAPNQLAELKSEHARAGLSDPMWEAFRLKFTGDASGTIEAERKRARERKRQLSGNAAVKPSPDDQQTEVSLLPADTPIEALPLSLLSAEEERLRRLIGVDKSNQRQHTQLSEKIRRADATFKSLEFQIQTSEEAKTEIEQKLKERDRSYEGVFAGIVAEEAALAELYAPLMKRLDQESGALGKLRFSIRRHVDVKGWADRGETLFDKRRTSGFQRLGSLHQAAMEHLAPSWQNGGAAAVSAAMAAFREKHDQDIRASAKIDANDDRPSWLRWLKDVSEWLYSTEHIRLSYGIQYEGVELETLSPGTRGIVLLLLYLAIDTEDDRPLIIDQPEENLDPKSIFEELVGLFRDAKHRRQIIVVTHNANLIVNTDAEQVIVAECGLLNAGSLPKFTYTSGSLENPVIRKHVCEILEGGERAFQERAKRLRVNLT